MLKTRSLPLSRQGIIDATEVVRKEAPTMAVSRI